MNAYRKLMRVYKNATHAVTIKHARECKLNLNIPKQKTIIPDIAALSS
jgi:hypothetical protein